MSLPDYVVLIDAYVNRTLSPADFQKLFFNKFKNDKILAEPVFLILDSLFSSLDAWTNDPVLLARPDNRYLSESTLRENAAAALAALKAL